MNLSLIAITLASSLTLSAQTAPAPRKIQVLIITGQDKQPWRETTPYLREILNQAGKFEVRVTEEFHGANAETLAPYDIAVLNYSDEKLDTPTWSPATKAALLAFVRSGKGLVYHHSAASFQDWEEFEKLSGCVWRTTDSYHSPVHDYTVDIRDADLSAPIQMCDALSRNTPKLSPGVEILLANCLAHYLDSGIIRSECEIDAPVQGGSGVSGMFTPDNALQTFEEREQFRRWPPFSRCRRVSSPARFQKASSTSRFI